MHRQTSARHAEELVFTSSEDGLLLEGSAFYPISAVQALSFVLVHGNAARFYDYGYVAICRALAAAGYPALSVNTRGHDIAAFVWRGDNGQPRAWQGPQDLPRAGGAAWERLEDTARDLAAWVEAASRLAQAVVLIGHSSGAQRVALYHAERQDARVRGLVLASPDLRGFLAPGELETAQRMVDEGRGLDVVPAQPFAPGYRQSAASIVSRAAVVERLRTALCATVTCPILAFAGDLEHGHANLLEGVRGQFGAASRITTELIAGADHIYSGRTGEVARAVSAWAGTLD